MGASCPRSRGLGATFAVVTALLVAGCPDPAPVGDEATSSAATAGTTSATSSSSSSTTSSTTSSTGGGGATATSTGSGGATASSTSATSTGGGGSTAQSTGTGGASSSSTGQGGGSCPAGSGGGGAVAPLATAADGFGSATAAAQGYSDVGGVAVDLNGNTIFVGSFRGTVTVGGSQDLTSAGGDDVFVAKYDPAGALLWAKRFGGMGQQHATGVGLVLTSGNIFITGWFDTPFMLGTTNLMMKGFHDGFLAKIHALDGSVDGVFLPVAYGIASGSVEPTSIALTPAGQIVLGGTYQGAVNFGTGALPFAGSTDIFVAKFLGDASCTWSFGFGDSTLQTLNTLALSPVDDEVIIAGDNLGSMTFGALPTITNNGLTDAFLAKLDKHGVPQFSRGFGDANSQYAQSVAVDGAGNIALTGQFAGNVDFGGGAATALVSANGSADGYVAKYDSSGAHLWSKAFGDNDAQGGHGILFDPDGDVILSGWFSGTVNFGFGQLMASPTDLFLAKLTGSSGAGVWQKKFSTLGSQVPVSLATGPCGGDLVVASMTNATMNFGNGTQPITSLANATAVCIARLAQ